MEFIKEFLGILMLFSAVGSGAWLLELLDRPKAVKRIGKRRLYISWSKEMQEESK